MIVDYKKFYTSLFTRRNSIDRSICADVNIIRFEYEVITIDVVRWILGTVKLADHGTNTDSPICQLLQVLMHFGKIPLDLSRHESRCHDRSVG